MTPDPKLKEILGKVYDQARGGLRAAEDASTYAQQRYDFVFHMTDWLTDLAELNAIYEHPDKAKLGRTTTEIIGFLYHVVPHLNAAGRLLLDEIGDPFAEDFEPHTAKQQPAPGKPKKRRRKPSTKAG